MGHSKNIPRQGWLQPPAEMSPPRRLRPFQGLIGIEPTDCKAAPIIAPSLLAIFRTIPYWKCPHGFSKKLGLSPSRLESCSSKPVYTEVRARSSAVEHLTFNQVVVGSIPTGLTISSIHNNPGTSRSDAF